MNILIAEDDDISRDLLRRILEREPEYTLTLTSDGEKAWAQLTDPAQRFDLGIFDLMMPRLSGLFWYDVRDATGNFTLRGTQVSSTFRALLREACR